MESYLDELLVSCSSSSSSNKWMIEVAKEELQILEAQHPNRFSFLKNEIESFIVSAESDKQQQQQLQNSSASVSTHASSNRMNKRKTRTDVAIERAEACLRKIRKLKESFINSSLFVGCDQHGKEAS